MQPRPHSCTVHLGEAINQQQNHVKQLKKLRAFELGETGFSYCGSTAFSKLALLKENHSECVHKKTALISKNYIWT